MSNEQLGQLYELMHATKDVWKSPEELNSETEVDDEFVHRLPSKQRGNNS